MKTLAQWCINLMWMAVGATWVGVGTHNTPLWICAFGVTLVLMGVHLLAARQWERSWT